MSWATVGTLIAAVGVTAYVTHWITAGPEQYCKTTSTAESWAPDRAYKATVFKKDCNSGESIFYSVRVDAFSPPSEANGSLPDNLKLTYGPISLGHRS